MNDTVTGKISSLGAFFVVLIAVIGVVELAHQPVMASQATPAALTEPDALVQRYCIGCHNTRLRTAGLALDDLDATNVRADAETWEKVVEKLRAGSMPPPGRPRPDSETYRAVAVSIEDKLDRAWADNPLSYTHLTLPTILLV